MRVKKLIQRIASGALAGIMLVSTLAVMPAEKVSAATPANQDASSAVNYATILGRATDFGIVANNFTHNNHMETTYAIKNLSQVDSNVTDVDFITGTAQFIIGKLVKGEIAIGSKQTANTYNMEIGKTAYGNFTYPWKDNNNNWQYIGHYGNFWIDYNFSEHSDQELMAYPVEDDTATANIQRIIDNAKDRGTDINNKANNASYVVNPDDYRVKDSNGNYDTAHYVMNFDNGEFENKVIYINVKSSSKITPFFAASEGIQIIKHPSTIIAFNFDKAITDIHLNKIAVSVDKGSKWITSTTGSSGATTADGHTNDEVDAQICQKIIWNINAKNAQVELINNAGTFIVPGTESFVDVRGSSAGWVVAGGDMVNHAEWHYIYKGGSQEVMRDGKGEIHFAARKSFTHAWNAANTKEDTTVFTEAGKYSFNWYETNSRFSTSSRTPIVVSNQATNTIKFPTIHFYTDSAHSSDAHYIKNSKKFYFLITEVGAGTYKDGVETSKGKIEIELLVTNSNGRLSYTVSSRTYLGNGALYKENQNINMSGVEFTLGAFFNLLSDGPSLTDMWISKVDAAGKELAGATLKLTGTDTDGKAVTFDADTMLELGSGAKAGTKSSEYLEFVSGTTPTRIKNLPDGDYTLVETNAPDGYKIATEITFTVKDGKVVASGITSAKVISQGTDGLYKVTMVDEAAPKTNVSISKKNTGSEELPGAILKLTGKDADGNAIVFDLSKVKLGTGAKMDKTTGTANEIVYTTGSTETLIQDLPDGEYTLEETVAPKGYKVATKITFTIKDGKVTASGTTDSKVISEGSDGYKVTMIDEAAPAANLKISKQTVDSKELPGATLSLTGKDAEGKDIEFDLSDVVLGTGADMTQKTGTTKEIVFTSGTTPTYVKNLPDGSYTLKETNAPEGYEIATEITFTVKDGKITVTSSDAKVLSKDGSDYKITVVDKAKPITGKAEATIQIEKTVTNKTTGSTAELSKEGYEFTLTGTSANAKGKVYKGTTDADGKLTIKIDDYKEAGTYEYVLKESEGLKDGITYDKTTYKVAVTVEVQDYAFVSPAKVVITKSSDSSAVTQPVKFENTYKAASTKAEIPALKTYTGEGAVLKDGQFGFTLSKKGETAVLANARNKADGSIIFKLEYDQPGTYEYVIREVKGSAPGVTYSESEFEVTVTVTDDGSGTLKAVVSGSAAEREFKNTYETTTVSENDAAFSLSLKKELSGDWSNEKDLKAGDYSFELTIQDKTYYEANKADGTVEFTDIVISGGDGDYSFTLKEVIPEPKVKGMTYDEKTVEGTVTVKDGKATVTAPTGEIVFTNKFSYEPTRFGVSLNKVISKIDGESLAGAVIKFTRDDGNFDMRDSRVSATQAGVTAKNLVKTKNYIAFTTTTDITVITGIASGDYTMSEVTAPDGYQKAADIKINVDDEGNVTAGGNMKGAVVVMIDDPFAVSPTPSPEPTPTEEVTPTPEPTPTGDITPTPGEDDDSTPTPTRGKKKPTPTPANENTPTPTPGGDGDGGPTPSGGGNGGGGTTPTPSGGSKGRPTPTPAGGGNGGNGGGNGGNGGGRNLDRSPQTGDHNTPIVFAVAGLISLACLGVVTIIEKKKKEEH